MKSILDDNDEWEDIRSFDEVLAAVKWKIHKKEPMMTAKEEFVEDIIQKGVELFGYDFIFEKH